MNKNLLFSFKTKEDYFNNNISKKYDNNINLINQNSNNDNKNPKLILNSISINNTINNKSKFHKTSKKGTKTQKKSSKKLCLEDSSNVSNNILYKYKKSEDNFLKSGLLMNSKDDLNICIEEYLSTDIDDMDYDDAIRKDKRKICNYFLVKLKANQIILNTFFYEEPIKPKPLKIILFLIQIDLYFFVNGLFFNEEYVSQIYHLEEDSFYECFQRFIGNFFYAALVGVMVSYIIDCFFIDERKIKGILKREKDNLLVLKYEIVQIIRNIKKRYISFIIISYIITIFTWYHISCFNNIYPHMKKEWLIFSIIIIILMQIFSVLICLLEAIIRFISFKCKSEKIYKISLLFA